MPIRVPSALPAGPILVIRLTCLGGGLPPSLVGGRAVVELLPSPGRTAWEEPPAKGELFPSWEGRCTIAWELLSSREGS